MTNSKTNQNSVQIFRGKAPAYWNIGYSVFPIANGTKAPPSTEDSKQWPSFCYNLPGEKKRNLLIERYGALGIALLLGMERKPGLRIAAVDVDDDQLVRTVKALLGDCPCAKRGKKGETIFVLADTSLKSTSIRDANEKGKIDILIGGKLTVLPPSIHPDTGQPYVWVGIPLLECPENQLPILTEDKLRLLRQIVESKHLGALLQGETTHDAGVSFSASLVAGGCDDGLIHKLFKALLPENYDGNSLEELQGWINSAREKGYDVRPKGPLDDRIAKIVAQQFAPLVFVRGDGFLQYKEGHWQKFSDSAFDRKAKELATPSLAPDQQVGSVLSNIRKCATLNLEREKFGEYSSKICVKNGTLDVETGELLAWSHDHELRYQLDFEYDPKSEAPLYEQQVYLTLCGDEKSVAAFEEFAGLTLILNLNFQKALYLVGPGGSGKSTLLKLVESMHSPDAVSVTPLDKIDNERYLTDLARKLVCISFDIQTERSVFGEAFIRITGGDLVATRKLYNEVEGRVKPTVRFMGSMNPNLPKFISSPDALERRLIFLKCSHKIEKPDPDMLTKLLKERPGILNRWIRALRRLLERGGFEIPDQSISAVDDYVNTQDPVQVFIADMLIKDPAALTPVSDILQEYNSWASVTNERQLSANVLGKKLQAAGLAISFSKKTSQGGKSARTYPVRLKRISDY